MSSSAPSTPSSSKSFELGLANARGGAVAVGGLVTARMLHHRWFFIAVVCLGVALALPSLRVGFVADDYTFIHRLEHSAPPSTWSSYEFVTGEPGERAHVMSRRWAAFPWWMSSNFKLRFLRPLASGLFALDHALFGHAPLGYHVHSLLWYALLLVAAGLFLRAVCSPPVWQIAFLLFALSAGHAESAAWISSRHMLIASAPALLGLVALIAHRERGFRWGLPLGLLGMLLGLLGSEAALSVVCYWLAYEALAEGGGRGIRQRLGRLALPLGCVAVYAVLYKWLGYGAAGSAAYLDPISAPRAFWPSLPGRLALLFGEAFAGFPSSLALTILPAAGIALGCAVTLGVVLALRSIWPRVEPAERRALLWLSVGATLALLPNAGAFLGPRLLLMPGIGAFVVIATLLRHGWPESALPAATLARRLLVSCLLLVHLGLAPLGLWLNCYLLGKLANQSAAVDASLDGYFARAGARTRQPPRVFILAASDPFAGFYTASVRSVRAPESTGQWSILSMARATHRIERTGPRELTLRIEPSMLRSTFEGLFRASDQPFAVGDQAALEGASVKVLAVEQGRPTSLALTLASGSFDDADVCLLAWRSSQLVPVQLALHEKLSIPWSPGPTGLL
jgi:hypothetical protein